MNKLVKFNIILFFLFCVELGALGSNLTEFHYKIVDEELKPYVTEYMGLLNKYCKSGNYNKSDRYVIFLQNFNDGRTMGLCERKWNGYSVQIDNTIFNNSAEKYRKQLLFHELSHCLINQEHSPDPNNYMNAVFPYLDANLVMKQTIDNIKNHCND
jgi:hypothetical protein